MSWTILAMAAAAAAVQSADHATMDHGAMVEASGTAVAVPTEPGQSAFAALGEIVRILITDPKTDWSRVDIGRLRQHLVDMDAVTMQSAATTERLANGARFVVTGPPPVAAAIQRMTTAHFAEPDISTGWTLASQPRADGSVVTVTAKDPAQVARIQALGFYGILTMGDHHQPHHLMMARGGMAH